METEHKSPCVKNKPWSEKQNRFLILYCTAVGSFLRCGNLIVSLELFVFSLCSGVHHLMVIEVPVCVASERGVEVVIDMATEVGLIEVRPSATGVR